MFNWFNKAPKLPDYVKRAEYETAYQDDLSAERKAAWFSMQRPRIRKSFQDPGLWFCVSKHERTVIIGGAASNRQYRRIGMGSTPAAAYQSWKDF